METISTILDGHNYVGWSSEVKSNLVTQDLWSVIESTTEPPNQEDDKVAFINWSKKDFKALQVIWNSCGNEAFSEIMGINSAKFVWDTLQEKYGIPDLREDNYMNWSIRVKSHLEAQDLWSIIESTSDPRQEDDEPVFINSRDKNFEALRVIRNFCGWRAFSDIKGIDSAKLVWGTLLKKYGTLDLCEDNYTKWSTRVKSDLEAQDLWSIIQSTSDPPKQEDDSDGFANWSEKNFKALCLIKKSCGRAISWIKEIKSAKTAWMTFAKMYDLQQNIATGKDLIEAVQCGNCGEIEEFHKHHPDFMDARITLEGKTALHIAVLREDVNVVEKLMQLLSKESLEIPTIYGSNPFHEATRYGNFPMVESMLRKNQKLILIDFFGQIPLNEALFSGHETLGRYLYYATPKQILVEGEAKHGAKVCIHAIYAQMWDIALDLIKSHPPLAFALDHNKASPVYALAYSAPEFTSGNRLLFWKRWIYSCVHIRLADATNEARLNIPSGQVRVNGSVRAPCHQLLRAPFHQLLSDLRNLLGLKHLYEKKLAHIRYSAILRHTFKEIPNLNTEERTRACIYLAMSRAIERGNFEFIFEIVRTNPELLWRSHPEGMSIFMEAVRYRQAEIFSLIYHLGGKNLMLTSRDRDGNYILHIAGMLAPSSKLNVLPGAALQMQRELQWFKKVESISLLAYRHSKNKEGKTAHELFTESHEDLRKDGEKWMKDTATSCTVVGALIATIMFAAAFTVPGGNYQDTGFPVFLHKKLFMLFIISDSISLFSSSISLLMFTGILTSRYAEEDFLKSLPRKMIIGLFTLFFSIATMMIAFCAAILLMLRGQSWTFIPLIGLATIPVSLFALNQFSLLVDMFKSTYGSSIFNKKRNHWV